MRDLTFVVVADALRSAQMWAKAGHDLGVSINIPYRLLDDPQFADGLATMLQAHDVGTQRVTLEVVPAGPGAGAQVDEDVLGRFDALGVRLSLDDAGRAASFAALRVLPLDELKIDVGFVHGLGKSIADAALVRGIIDIGHALGLQVVAEGVETRNAWSVLGEWGCDYAQGFYVASPRSATSSSSGSGLPGPPSPDALRERLHGERQPDDHEHEAEREPKGVLRHAAGGSRAQPAAGERARHTRGEYRPVDSAFCGVRREARDPEHEADDQVRARRTPDVHSHRADECRHCASFRESPRRRRRALRSGSRVQSRDRGEDDAAAEPGSA